MSTDNSALRDELARVKARLRELEAGPRPRQDLASDAAEYVRRSFEQSKGEPVNYITRDMRSAETGSRSLRPESKSAALFGFSREDVEAAGNYARWLGRKEFNDGMNVMRREFGLPTDRTPVFLDQRGKAVYEKALREVRKGSVVYTLEGERKAVMRLLRGY